MDEKPRIKDVYNQIGQQFSASRNYIWPDLKPFVEQVGPNSSVLDAGCGNARLLTGLPKSIKYTGIDFSNTLLETAKKSHPKIKFIEADVTDPKTWDKLPKYDYIFCIAVIHHISSPSDHLSLLKQIKKHLNPNGKFLITAWNLWQPKYRKHHLDIKTKLQNLHHVYIPFQGKPRFHFAFTKHYLKQLLHQSSTKGIIQTSDHNYLIHNFYNGSPN